jgi:hypothetical protein
MKPVDHSNAKNRTRKRFIRCIGGHRRAANDSNGSFFKSIYHKTTHFLTNLALVAFVFTSCFLFLKHYNLASALFLTKGVYHLANLDVQGFIFAITIVLFFWLVFRYAFYLAIWLVIWVFYGKTFLTFLATFGVK